MLSEWEQATRVRVLTLGETMGLIRSTEPGLLRSGASLKLSIGGAETNVAIGLRRLGVGVRWLGRVGEDPIGSVVLATLRAEGVEIAGHTHSSRPTGLMLKQIPRSGTAHVTYYRAASAASTMSPDLLQPAMFTDVELLHLTGITSGLSPSCAALVREAARMARDHGAHVSLDINYRASLWDREEARTELRRLLPLVDTVFGGHDELALVLDEDGQAGPLTEVELLTSLVASGPREVVLKRGMRGAAAFHDDKYTEAAAFEVAPVDTVGAGDAFVAGYLAALLDGRSIEKRVREANACGALACLNAGDWEGAPTRRDLDAFLGSADPVVR